MERGEKEGVNTMNDMQPLRNSHLFSGSICNSSRQLSSSVASTEAVAAGGAEWKATPTSPSHQPLESPGEDGSVYCLGQNGAVSRLTSLNGQPDLLTLVLHPHSHSPLLPF